MPAWQIFWHFEPQPPPTNVNISTPAKVRQPQSDERRVTLQSTMKVSAASSLGSNFMGVPYF
jgi:hypothetical protein